MKKILSILFASLILVSGMHLSLAVHYCGGDLVASKISLSEQKAECGMESGKSECPIHGKNEVNSNCCKNEVTVYSVDGTYRTSSFEFKQFTSNLLQVFYVPSSIGLSNNLYNLAYIANVSPPINLMVRQVNLPDICVFRI